MWSGCRSETRPETIRRDRFRAECAERRAAPESSPRGGRFSPTPRFGRGPIFPVSSLIFCKQERIDFFNLLNDKSFKCGERGSEMDALILQSYYDVFKFHTVG